MNNKNYLLEVLKMLEEFYTILNLNLIMIHTYIIQYALIYALIFLKKPN